MCWLNLLTVICCEVVVCLSFFLFNEHLLVLTLVNFNPRSKLGSNRRANISISPIREVNRGPTDLKQSSFAQKADLELGTCYEISFLMSLPFVVRAWPQSEFLAGEPTDCCNRF